jgi:PIN domain nuclease of toxin-antitoxin system
MKYLLDTQILLWAAAGSERLSRTARKLIETEASTLFFSPASIWEVAIKRALGRDDFDVDPRTLRRGLLDNDYRELPITGEHAAAVMELPDLHRDPFDRLLIAQARSERFVLVTSDTAIANYPGQIQRV